MSRARLRARGMYLETGYDISNGMVGARHLALPHICVDYVSIEYVNKRV